MRFPRVRTLLTGMFVLSTKCNRMPSVAKVDFHSLGSNKGLIYACIFIECFCSIAIYYPLALGLCVRERQKERKREREKERVREREREDAKR